MYEILAQIAKSEKNPVIVQDLVCSKFHELLRVGPLSAWTPGELIPDDKTRVLVGVAPSWNVEDRNLLVWLEQLVRDGKTAHLTLQLFDTDECQSLEQLRAYMPNIREAFHVPIVGVWNNGVEVKHASGFAARELLRELIYSNV